MSRTADVYYEGYPEAREVTVTENAGGTSTWIWVIWLIAALLILVTLIFVSLTLVKVKGSTPLLSSTTSLRRRKTKSRISSVPA